MKRTEAKKPIAAVETGMIDTEALLRTFISDSLEQAAELERLLLELEEQGHSPEIINAIYRVVHTIKGGSGVVGHSSLRKFSHELEEALDPLRSGDTKVTPEKVSLFLRCTDLIRDLIVSPPGEPPADASLMSELHELLRLQNSSAFPSDEHLPPQQEKVHAAPNKRPERSVASGTVRVEMPKLDHLVNTVGEMVIIQSMFRQELACGADIPQSLLLERMERICLQLTRIGENVQQAAMALRMLPVREVFRRFERVVRDVAAETAKEVDLYWTGEETEVDKAILEKIADPLIHLVRNAIDHGIEPPQEREQLRKSRCGTLCLRAFQEAGNIRIDVTDDGRGLDYHRVVQKAKENGLLQCGEDLSPEQINLLIFKPGFSTAENITGISGRGVGLDAVLGNIEALSGRVQISSTPGEGTTVSLSVPLTLAIIDGLVVRAGGETVVIPLAVVLESRKVPAEERKTVGGTAELMLIRDNYIPVISLRGFLEVSPSTPWGNDGIAVVVSCGHRTCAIEVEQVIGQQPVVLKTLGDATPRVRGISGGTIMGDGRVALVLDVAAVMEQAF